MKTERLQKVLAKAGLGSRREMEKWIDAGMVKVNGVVATLGMSVTSKDRLHVKGKLLKNPLTYHAQTKVILYHKPVGEICTREDPEGRKTVFQAIPRLNKGRWIMVGRLDINTSGLLLFTNNGELANKLMHPRFEIEREYAVRVFGTVEKSTLKTLKEGVELEDGRAAFTSIQYKGGEGANSWYHVTLNEGRNREVRRLWESQGIEVSRLVRVRFGNIAMPRGLKRGAYLQLDSEQLKALLELTD